MFLEVDGLRVHVEHSGSGPALLLLHGWGSSLRSFASLFPALERSHSVWAIDFPGFGLSALPASPWNVSDYVAFVEHVMARLGIGRARVLGHSHGGRVSIALAARAPALVDRLILVNSAGIRPPRTLRLRMRGWLARSARRTLGHPRAGTYGQRALIALYRRLGMSDYASAGPLRATFVRIVNEDLSPLLPLVEAETLVVWGDRDAETPLWMGQQMARELPRGHLVVLHDAGHYSFLDQPEAFLTEVGDFLDRA